MFLEPVTADLMPAVWLLVFGWAVLGLWLWLTDALKGPGPL